MKLCLTALLVTLVTLLHPEYARANSICPRENCLERWKCEDLVVGGTCPQSSDTCCSVVKSEQRTHCRHFGGECMDWCHEDLQQTVVDCPSDKMCCTLV